MNGLQKINNYQTTPLEHQHSQKQCSKSHEDTKTHKLSNKAPRHQGILPSCKT